MDNNKKEQIRKEKLEKLKQISNEVLKVYGNQENNGKSKAEDYEQDER